MELLEEVLRRYLSNPNTYYALNIDGSWGSGKTYLIKKDLGNVLETSGNYVLAYVSLNGLKDLNDILASLDFPYGKAEEFDNYLLKTNRLEYLKFYKERILVCFDDLERTDRKCSIESVLGYINANFIEHNKIKTIIISNSEEISNAQKYTKIREKLIGRTITYKSNNQKIIENIIKDFPRLQSFYQTSGIMSALFDTYEKLNFRSLRFIFEITEEVFHFIDQTEDKIRNNGEILFRIFVFCFVAGIEYKKGTITTIEQGEETLDPFNYHFYKETDKSGHVFEQFKNNVIIKNNLSFFMSLLEFIITGHFDRERLLSELMEKFSFENIEDKSLNIIDYYDEYELDELATSIKIVLKAVNDGYYNPLKYPNIYLLVKEILDKGYFTIQEPLEEIFLNGLSNALSKISIEYIEDRKFERYLVSSEDKIYLKIVSIIRNQREKLYEDQVNYEVDKFIDAIKRNDYSVLSKSVNYFSRKRHFLKYLSERNFETDLIRFSNKSLNSFATTLNELFFKNSHNYGKSIDEINDISDFKTSIKSAMEKFNNIDKLKRDRIENVINGLDEVISHLKNNK